MKKLFWFIAGIVVIFYFLSRDYSTSNPSTPSTTVSGSTAGNEQALVVIRKEESKIFEAFISDVDVLYVSVADDGTRRDGYASYLCEILRENDAKANRVKVVEVNSTNDPDRDNAYGVLLGESWCK
jgi:hypothetical protein